MDPSALPDLIKADFNAPPCVLHYARAAVSIGLWKTEELVFLRTFSPESRILEIGCGAGRVTFGLHERGYRQLTGVDFAANMIEQARDLGARIAPEVTFIEADATSLPWKEEMFDGAIFAFNGLMQIPGRARRRLAMAEIRRVVRPGGRFVFTSHDREEPTEAPYWREEAAVWEAGRQDPRLTEFGDRYFSGPEGNTFMHLPTRSEILADLGATGWLHESDALRRSLASESRAVREFSDECRFWICRNGGLAADVRGSEY